MTGIYRERPGAEAISACRGEPAVDLGDGIWMSPGLSNSYLLVGERDHTIINTGMGFEGPLHQRAYAGLAVGEPHSIIFTQGHYDHVGGVDVLRGPGTEVIAQRNFDVWRADNERLESFRSRNAAFAWIDAILAAMSYADSLGVGNVAQARPNPTHLIDEDETLDAGGRAVRAISVPGGETTDALVLWLEDSRTAFTGNLTGPLFGHVPNLVTMRGDRYRDALTYIASLEKVIQLRPDRVITGHFDPILGADRIEAELTALCEATRWLHDRTVDGMNAGTDVFTLMREISLPSRFDLGEGYGKTSWNVRAIWENYAGWFHHRSTAELYGVAPLDISADLVAAAGVDALLAAANARLAADEPVHALRLADVILAAEPHHRPTRELVVAASRALLDRSDNFWEAAWLRRSIDRTASTS